MADESNNMRLSVGFKKILIFVSFVLFSVLLLGAFYLFMTPGQTVNFVFSYVVGLSMIVLPCTLPLALVIVPLAMTKKPKRGLLMALYFGLGLTITLSLYGIFVAFIGKIIGLDQAIVEASTVSRVLFIIGGAAAYMFGLSELNLIKFSVPSFGGGYPVFIQRRKDYLKAFLLGLFLGNAGVGCPNPLFYVLLGDIAVVGSVSYGWLLGFIHGLGRATPLVFLSILGILGVNAVTGIAQKAVLVKKFTATMLIVLGAFIFIVGTSHEWYENSFVHRGWNRAITLVVGEKIAEHEHDPGIPEEHEHEMPLEEETGHEHEIEDFIPAPWSWITLLFLSFVPLICYKLKRND